MPKDLRKSSTSRQRPVSCYFCRSRKLRCSREAPCSNCRSRDLVCELFNPAALTPNESTTSSSECGILEPSHQPNVFRENQDLDRSENIKPNDTVSDSELPASQLQHLSNDIAWLKSIYTGQDNTVSRSRVLREEVALTRIRGQYRLMS
jgi:hypothetical protein